MSEAKLLKRNSKRKKFSVLLLYQWLLILWVLPEVRSQSQLERIQQRDSSVYTNRETLDNGNYILEWVVDWNLRQIMFQTTVATRGYVGLGLSAKGRMDGADIVMGGVMPNGTAYFTDRHGRGNQEPTIDESQDWELLKAQENATHTVLRFSRGLDTCDMQDYPINEYDSVVILWAYGKTDDAQYHVSNRGQIPVHLMDPNVVPPQIKAASLNRGPPSQRVLSQENLYLWTLKTKLKLPPKDTLHYCTIHQGPKLRRKHHIVGFNTRLETEQVVRHTHQVLLFRCQTPPNSDPEQVWGPFVNRDGQECYSLDNPTGEIPTQYCSEIAYVFGIGGKILWYPDHVGQAIGETRDEFYLLKVHYDNPEKRTDIQYKINVDVYYTDHLRSNEVGVMSMGHETPGTSSLLIPPDSLNHQVFGHCVAECTDRMLPKDGINVFMAVHHTHFAGRKIRVRHIRKEQELPWIGEDSNYDATYHGYRLLNDEVNIRPGDHIMVQCTYDSTESNGTVVGGYSTRKQEACLAYLFFYNRLRDVYKSCRSEIRDEFYQRRYLGVSSSTWDENKLEMVAVLPTRLANKTMTSISDTEVNWSQDLRRELQEDHKTLPQVASCSRDDAVSIYAQSQGQEAWKTYVARNPTGIIEYTPPQRMCSRNLEEIEGMMHNEINIGPNDYRMNSQVVDFDLGEISHHVRSRGPKSGNRNTKVNEDSKSNYNSNRGSSSKSTTTRPLIDTRRSSFNRIDGSKPNTHTTSNRVAPQTGNFIRLGGSIKLSSKFNHTSSFNVYSGVTQPSPAGPVENSNRPTSNSYTRVDNSVPRHRTTSRTTSTHRATISTDLEFVSRERGSTYRTSTHRTSTSKRPSVTTQPEVYGREIGNNGRIQLPDGSNPSNSGSTTPAPRQNKGRFSAQIKSQNNSDSGNHRDVFSYILLPNQQKPSSGRGRNRNRTPVDLSGLSGTPMMSIPVNSMEDESDEEINNSQAEVEQPRPPTSSRAKENNLNDNVEQMRPVERKKTDSIRGNENIQNNLGETMRPMGGNQQSNSSEEENNSDDSRDLVGSTEENDQTQKINSLRDNQDIMANKAKTHSHGGKVGNKKTTSSRGRENIGYSSEEMHPVGRNKQQMSFMNNENILSHNMKQKVPVGWSGGISQVNSYRGNENILDDSIEQVLSFRGNTKTNSLMNNLNIADDTDDRMEEVRPMRGNNGSKKTNSLKNKENIRDETMEQVNPDEGEITNMRVNSLRENKHSPNDNLEEMRPLRGSKGNKKSNSARNKENTRDDSMERVNPYEGEIRNMDSLRQKENIPNDNAEEMRPLKNSRGNKKTSSLRNKENTRDDSMEKLNPYEGSIRNMPINLFMEDENIPNENLEEIRPLKVTTNSKKANSMRGKQNSIEGDARKKTTSFFREKEVIPNVSMEKIRPDGGKSENKKANSLMEQEEIIDDMEEMHPIVGNVGNMYMNSFKSNQNSLDNMGQDGPLTGNVESMLVDPYQDNENIVDDNINQMSPMVGNVGNMQIDSYMDNENMVDDNMDQNRPLEGNTGNMQNENIMDDNMEQDGWNQSHKKKNSLKGKKKNQDENRSVGGKKQKLPSMEQENNEDEGNTGIMQNENIMDYNMEQELPLGWNQSHKKKNSSKGKKKNQDENRSVGGKKQKLPSMEQENNEDEGNIGIMQNENIMDDNMEQELPLGWNQSHKKKNSSKGKKKNQDENRSVGGKKQKISSMEQENNEDDNTEEMRPMGENQETPYNLNEADLPNQEMPYSTQGRDRNRIPAVDLASITRQIDNQLDSMKQGKDKGAEQGRSKKPKGGKKKSKYENNDQTRPYEYGVIEQPDAFNDKVKHYTDIYDSVSPYTNLGITEAGEDLAKINTPDGGSQVKFERNYGQEKAKGNGENGNKIQMPTHSIPDLPSPIGNAGALFGSLGANLNPHNPLNNIDISYLIPNINVLGKLNHQIHVVHGSGLDTNSIGEEGESHVIIENDFGKGGCGGCADRLRSIGADDSISYNTWGGNESKEGANNGNQDVFLNKVTKWGWKSEKSEDDDKK